MQVERRGKLTREIEARSSDGDLLFDLFASKPHQVPKKSSAIQGCTLGEGEFGKNGFIITWNYTHDGKACFAKEIIENLDMEKKKITYRVIEGDLLNHCNTFLIHLHVVPKFGGISVVTWALEYEKISEEMPDPTSFADYLVHVTKQTLKYD